MLDILFFRYTNYSKNNLFSKLKIFLCWKKQLIMQKKAIIFFIVTFISLVSSDLKAFSIADSLKMLIPRKSKAESIEIYLEISKSYLTTNSDSVLKYANKGLLLSQEINNNQFVPDFYQIIGYANYYKRNYNLSIDYFKKALEIFDSRKNKKKIADINAYLGIVYQDTYNYDKSLQYFYKSIKLYKILNDSANISGIYNNIGLLFFRIDKYDKAEFYLKLSLKTALKEELHKGVAFTYNNLSLIYLKKNQLQEALYCLIKSEETLKKINDNISLIATYENIGETLFKLKRYKEAEGFFQKSLGLTVKQNISISQASLYYNFAKLNLEKKNFQKAKDFLELAANILRNQQDWGIEKKVYSLFSEYYKSVNDYENAYVYLKKYKAINDSIFNQESIENIEKLKIQFETSEIETENELLKQKDIIQDIAIKKQNYTRNIYVISILIILVIILLVVYRFTKKRSANFILQEKNNFISFQREQLEEANITKDKFLSIIAHDLKNPFFYFKQYSDYLTIKDSLDFIDKNEIITDLKSVSDNTHILLENLLNWAETQRKAISINKSLLNVRELVTESIQPHLISSEKKNIKVQLDINPSDNIFVDRYTLNTIIRNLFYNAIKFTHPFGEIIIKSEVINATTQISIIDNGLGIAPENLKELFKLKTKESGIGTNNEKGNGLGLIICKEFTELNGGEIFAESELNKGSVFKIIINNPKN